MMPIFDGSCDAFAFYQRGGPWENGLLKDSSELSRKKFISTPMKDIHEARARIGHFITQVYYHKRPHSALGYLTPVEFQRQNRD